MKITDIKVYLPEVNSEKVKAFVTIVVDDCLVIKDVKIVQGEERIFVSMPSKKRTDGSRRDVVHPINDRTRLMLEMVVMDAYEKAKLAVC